MAGTRWYSVILIFIGVLSTVYGQLSDPCQPFDCKDFPQRSKHSLPDSCVKYIECRGNSRHKLDCPSGTLFDHDARECRSGLECRLACPLTICGQDISCALNSLLQKNISNPDNCQQYFQCRTSDMYLMACPSKNKFDIRTSICKPSIDSTVLCAPCQQRPPTPTPAPTTPVPTTTSEPTTPSALTTVATTKGNVMTPAPTTQAIDRVQTTSQASLPACNNPSSCTTDLNGNFFPNPGFCSSFFRCANGAFIAMDCAIGTLFDKNSLSCINKNEAQCQGKCNGEPLTALSTVGQLPDTTQNPTSAELIPTTTEGQIPPVVTTVSDVVTSTSGNQDMASTSPDKPSTSDSQPKTDVPPTSQSNSDIVSTAPSLETTTAIDGESTVGQGNPETTVQSQDTTKLPDAVASTVDTTLSDMISVSDGSGTLPQQSENVPEVTSPATTAVSSESPSSPVLPGSSSSVSITTSTTPGVIPSSSTTQGVGSSVDPVGTSTGSTSSPGSGQSTISGISPTGNEPSQSTVMSTQIPVPDREITLQMVPPNNIFEGYTAVFQCEAFLPSEALLKLELDFVQPQLVWRLKGRPITAKGGRAAIETQDRFLIEEIISSTLTIDNMRLTDSGLLECLIVDRNNKDTVITSGDLNAGVLGLPIVKIILPLALVNPGEEVEIQCQIEVPETTHPDSTKSPIVNWYKEGMYLQPSGMDDEEADISSLLSGGSQLRIKLYERSTISCFAQNAAGSSDVASRVVNVISPDVEPLYCEEEIVDGILWKRTLVGGERFQSCQPLGATGDARRECQQQEEDHDQDQAEWEDPNYGDCVRPQFTEVLVNINNAEDNLGPINSSILTSTAHVMEELTQQEKQLLPGDVKVLVEVISTMVHIRKDKHMDLPVEEVEAITHTISNMLTDENMDAWDNIEEDKPHLSVQLMRAMDSYAAMLVQGLPPGGNKTIITPNVVMMVEAMLKSNTVTVQFPNDIFTEAPAWAQGSTDFIMLEKQTFDSIKDFIDGDTIDVSAAYYRNLDQVLPTSERSKVNSKVVAMSIHGLHRDIALKPPVQMHFSLGMEYPSNMTNECAFWNFTIPPRGAWSKVGCTTTYNEDGTVNCMCNHLTNFAMLVSPGPVSDFHHYILSMISLVGCIISIVALLLTILFYCSMWKSVKSHHAAVLINLCIALIIGNALFIAGVDRTENTMVCTIIAALLHYFWLAAFFIMLVEGIQLLLYIIYVFHVRRKRDTIALLFGGWMFPAVIVGISLAITQLEGYGTDKVCWLSVKSGLLWAFVGPVLAVIGVNLVILVIVLRRALSAKIPTAKKKNKLRSAVWNILVITPLLGITWVLGVFSVNDDTVVFQYIFAICNSLQGLFIFVFHALCNKKLREAASSSGQQTFSTVKAHALHKKNDYDQKGRYALKGTNQSDPKNTLSSQKTGSGQNSTRTNNANGIKQMNNHITNGPNGNITYDHQTNLNRNDTYSSGTRPPLYQQLSEGKEVTSPQDIEIMAKRTSAASTLPPSPTTATTELSWTSDKELNRWHTAA